MSSILEDYPEYLAFLERSLNGILKTEFRGWDHAQSRVWRVTAQQGRACYLKGFAENRKFRQELRFYQHWRTAVSGMTPELLGHDASCRAVLLSEVPGQPLEQSAQTPLIYRQAGKFLRALHQFPQEDGDIPLREAYEKRLTAWCRRAQGKLPEEDVRWLSAGMERTLPLLSHSMRRVPCHRDFRPRNWLVGGGQLKVIDFEHSRPDLALSDFEHLYLEHWTERADFAGAFWEGYGRELSREEEEILIGCCCLNVLATLSWATEHADREFHQRGRRMLARLKKLHDRL